MQNEKLVWITKAETFRGATTSMDKTFFVKENEIYMEDKKIETLLNVVEFGNSYGTSDYFEASMGLITDDVIICSFSSTMDYKKLVETKESENINTIYLNEKLSQNQIEIVKSYFEDKFNKEDRIERDNEVYIVKNSFKYEIFDEEKAIVKDKENINYYNEYKLNVA